jgi:hypothetical protein
VDMACILPEERRRSISKTCLQFLGLQNSMFLTSRVAGQCSRGVLKIKMSILKAMDATFAREITDASLATV